MSPKATEMLHEDSLRNNQIGAMGKDVTDQHRPKVDIGNCMLSCLQSIIKGLYLLLGKRTSWLALVPWAHLLQR